MATLHTICFVDMRILQECSTSFTTPNFLYIPSNRTWESLAHDLLRKTWENTCSSQLFIIVRGFFIHWRSQPNVRVVSDNKMQCEDESIDANMKA